MLQSLRFALRQLRKSPGFTLAAVLTLAFGIGATTAIFSIVEGVLLRPLPFAQPKSLVLVGDVLDGAGASISMPMVAAPEVAEYAGSTHSFSSLGAYRQTSYELSGLGVPAQINASRLTAGIFSTLGVQPLLGRVFTKQEDESREQVVVLSYATWRNRFHGDPDVLGQKILLDRKSYQIIGVMPREFEFPLVPGQLNRSELWVPMSFTPTEISQGSASWNYLMVGRLKPGVTAAQAQQDAGLVARQIMRNFPSFMSSVRIHSVVESLNDATVSEARPLVRTLFLAVIVVLFIACANLAGLLLVRVIRRRREIAVRLALGASAAAVLRQNLIEALTLSVLGGFMGLVFAATALRVGISFLPETLPRIGSIHLDWKVMLFALLLTILTGLLCGIAPAIAASRTAVNETLKEGGRTGSAGGGHARLRSVLVVSELAVALVLLSAAGLLLRSFQKLRAVDLGFRTDHLLTASYGLPQQQYSTQSAIDAFNDNLLRKLQQLPGVKLAGITTVLPESGGYNNTGFIPEGYVPANGSNLNMASWSEVMGDYFRAAGIPLLRGRLFTPADRAGSPLVIIISRGLAEEYWPGQDPIGKRIHIGVKETPTPWLTVVGEVGDVKDVAPDKPAGSQIYEPTGQFITALGTLATPGMLDGNYGSIVLRGPLPPEQLVNSLRQVVHSLDPLLPLTQVETMEQVVSEGQASRRFNTVLISSFAAAAVLLALLGIYSVIAFSATLRAQEMAIRLALGSQRASVMRLVIASAAKLGLAGCVLGAAAALFATHLLRSLLFQVDPLDPAVLVLAAVSIFLLALAASVIPARRAASIEPMQALRTE